VSHKPATKLRFNPRAGVPLSETALRFSPGPSLPDVRRFLPSACSLSSSVASSANFADQSPRRAIVADRRDAVTKLIRRSLQRAILSVGEFGLGGGAQRTAAFRPVKGKNDQLVETGADS